MSPFSSWTRIALLVVGIFSFVSLGCGGGGGSSSGGTLEGRWLGPMESSDGTMAVLTVVVNSKNQITSVLTNGTLTGQTGTITKVSGESQIYSVALSDGTIAGFYVDTSKTHAVFVDDDFNFGVVQKGASGLAAKYEANEIFGKNYSGISVVLDHNFDLLQTMTTTANVTPIGALDGFHGTGDSFTTTGGTDVQIFESQYGVWSGKILDTDENKLGLRIIASPDKKVFGAYAGPLDWSGFPEDWTFSIMTEN